MPLNIINEKLHFQKVLHDKKFATWTFAALYVNKYGCYLVGHATIITEGFEQLTLTSPKRYVGLIKCVVLPPRKLFHSVLPFRCDGKLTFPLCQMCVLI